MVWKTIAIWWLAFKPKTDDIRDAPSIAVINKLLELGVDKIQLFDPVAMNNVKKYYNPSPLHSSEGLPLEKGEKKLIFWKDNYDSVSWADALLIITEWDMFRMPDFKRIKELMAWNIIIDGRNIWNKEELISYGFTYEGVWK